MLRMPDPTPGRQCATTERRQRHRHRHRTGAAAGLSCLVRPHHTAAGAVCREVAPSPRAACPRDETGAARSLVATVGI
jgi:hypothetical protein